MATRCKVTFFDLEHRLRRSVEVPAALPIPAAEAGLRKMLESHLLPENFGGVVQVEVISTVQVFLPLAEITERLVPATDAEAA
jgi:hypothetical protein